MEKKLIWTFKILKEIISRSEEACVMVAKVTLYEQYLLTFEGKNRIRTCVPTKTSRNANMSYHM
jgi:hypothetical protein